MDGGIQDPGYFRVTAEPRLVPCGESSHMLPEEESPFPIHPRPARRAVVQPDGFHVPSGRTSWAFRQEPLPSREWHAPGRTQLTPLSLSCFPNRSRSSLPSHLEEGFPRDGNPAVENPVHQPAPVANPPCREARFPGRGKMPQNIPRPGKIENELIN